MCLTCLCSENTRATRIFFFGHLVFLYRDLKQQRRRRRQSKRREKIKSASFQTLSPLLGPAQFVKCIPFLLELNC